jgi:hypothetical protein
MKCTDPTDAASGLHVGLTRDIDFFNGTDFGDWVKHGVRLNGNNIEIYNDTTVQGSAFPWIPTVGDIITFQYNNNRITWYVTPSTSTSVSNNSGNGGVLGQRQEIGSYTYTDTTNTTTYNYYDDPWCFVALWNTTSTKFNAVDIPTGAQINNEQQRFGWSVDISDDGQYVVIGAKNKNASTGNAGAAYVMRYDEMFEHWRQVGGTIYFEQASAMTNGSLTTNDPTFSTNYTQSTNEYFGWSVKFDKGSGPCRRVAIGARSVDHNTNGTVGAVQIWGWGKQQLSNSGIIYINDWLLECPTLWGDTNGAYLCDIDISTYNLGRDDIALKHTILATSWGDNKVQCYNIPNNTTTTAMTTFGQELNGTTSGNLTGTPAMNNADANARFLTYGGSIAISDFIFDNENGNDTGNQEISIVIGGGKCTPSGGVQNDGICEVYRLNTGTTTWAQVGQTISGSSSNCGKLVDISSDGRCIMYSGDTTTNNTERVWDGTNWTISQFHSATDFSGLAINGDGTRSIQSYYTTSGGTANGTIDILCAKDATNTSIYKPEMFGYKTAISTDGATMAVLSRNHGTPFPEAGRIILYSWNGTTWTIKGKPIELTDSNVVLCPASERQIIEFIALSGDGSTVAYSANGLLHKANDRVLIFSDRGSFAQVGRGIIKTYSYETANGIWRQKADTLWGGKPKFDGYGGSKYGDIALNNTGSRLFAYYHDNRDISVTNCGVKIYDLDTTTGITANKCRIICNGWVGQGSNGILTAGNHYNDGSIMDSQTSLQEIECYTGTALSGTNVALSGVASSETLYGNGNTTFTDSLPVEAIDGVAGSSNQFTMTNNRWSWLHSAANEKGVWPSMIHWWEVEFSANNTIKSMQIRNRDAGWMTYTRHGALDARWPTGFELINDLGEVIYYQDYIDFGLLDSVFSFIPSSSDNWTHTNSGLTGVRNVIMTQWTLSKHIDNSPNTGLTGLEQILQGDYVDCSTDGTILAFGDWTDSINNGRISIYENTGGNTWNLSGFFGGNSVQKLGYTVHISGDGLNLLYNDQVLGTGILKTYDGISAWNDHSYTTNPGIGYQINARNGISNDATYLLTGLEQSSGTTTARVHYTVSTTSAQDMNFGHSVAIDNTGTIVAIGAPEYDNATHTNAGIVGVYEYNTSTPNDWSLRGSTIEFSDANKIAANNELTGYKVSLSSDGRVLAFIAKSATHNSLGSNVGVLHIYEYNTSNPNDWSTTGPPVWGSAAEEFISLDFNAGTYSPSLSNCIVAVGTNTNKVTVYYFNGFDWVPKGSPITPPSGSGNNTWGESIKLDDAGTTIIIGGSTSNTNGEVAVFTHDGGSPGNWIQKGNTFNGNAGELLGKEVSISGDANTITISSGNLTASTNRVYKYESTFNAWFEYYNWPNNNSKDSIYTHINQLGTKLAIGGTELSSADHGQVEIVDLTIAPQNNLLTGNFIAVNDNGNGTSESHTVIVGTPYFDRGVNSEHGRVDVYEFSGGTYTRKGNPILFDDNNRSNIRNGEYTGSGGVCISADADTIAFACKSSEHVSIGDNVGAVQVFTWIGSVWI